VIRARWVYWEESEQDEVDRMKEEADLTGKVMHIQKSAW